MKWVTCSNVGIDRIACAWLIKRNIDSDAIKYLLNIKVASYGITS